MKKVWNKAWKRSHPLYSIWMGIKGRCECETNPEYWKYGGIGINFHPGWRDSLEEFAAYLGPRPSPKHSVDRYPNIHGGYVPGNVRWASPTEQIANRRPSRKITRNASPANKKAYAALRKRYSGDEIAKMLDISRQAVWKWDEVPARFVLKLEELTRIPREKLHPDLYFGYRKIEG